MPSRIWLSVAFVIAFGASPAQAGTQRPAAAVLACSGPGTATAAERGADPAPVVEAGAPSAVAN
ncbi:MAG: hypothetical protein WBQ45_15930 [Roseiarcus sp.]|jgi:hypothetical protein|uniref:hypothetical protein n=1 Tax=Roseiarcus sp. TaxID=1969460 RepID=UPI003BAF30E4